MTRSTIQQAIEHAIAYGRIVTVTIAGRSWRVSPAGIISEA